MTIDELKILAAEFRAMHKLNGVIIIGFEPAQTPFGFAWLDVDKGILSKAAPEKLREIAAIMERGMELTPHVAELT